MRQLLLSCMTCIFILTACGETPEPVIVPEFVEIHVPSSLLECASIPPTPGLDATQKDAAIFTGALAVAYVDCRDNLDTVAQIIYEFNQAGIPQ